MSNIAPGTLKYDRLPGVMTWGIRNGQDGTSTMVEQRQPGRRKKTKKSEVIRTNTEYAGRQAGRKEDQGGSDGCLCPLNMSLVSPSCLCVSVKNAEMSAAAAVGSAMP